jgi:hypothetical protein
MLALLHPPVLSIPTRGRTQTILDLNRITIFKELTQLAGIKRSVLREEGDTPPIQRRLDPEGLAYQLADISRQKQRPRREPHEPNLGISNLSRNRGYNLSQTTRLGVTSDKHLTERLWMQRGRDEDISKVIDMDQMV